MHYTLEIILPKTETLADDIAKIMAPFKEEIEENSHPFWDFYILGGRFSGQKLQASLDQEKISAFWERLQNEDIKVRSLVSGKQEIATKEQEILVDQIWSDSFPEAGLPKCPFFKHSNNQYDSSDTLPMDVCLLSEVPESYKCSRVIIAAKKYDNELGAEFMISTDFWNGVTHVGSNWNGNVKKAVQMFQESMGNYTDVYKAKFNFENFICVTVDYHS